MSWSRSDSNPTSRETSWRSRGCGCCSTSYGFEFDPDHAYLEPITKLQMEIIVNELRSTLRQAELDLEWLKGRKSD